MELEDDEYRRTTWKEIRWEMGVSYEQCKGHGITAFILELVGPDSIPEA
jgi:hypothetical protein